ncbi:MAG TPA: Fe-S cluster assembly protein SufD [Candidatus Binatia bacterium]|nr:Fe-S cluster assembly protein SufD [Candidatus Binatia bacterium]
MVETPSKEHYLSVFSRYYENGTNHASPWLKELRSAGARSFEEVGFPSTKREDWKYTNVDPITSVRFERTNGKTRRVEPEKIFSAALADAADNRLVFINGRFCSELSWLRATATEMQVASLAQVIAEEGSVVESYLGRYASHQEEGFVALNTAFLEDGAFVLMPRGRIVDDPVYLIFVSLEADRPIVSYPRNLLVFEEGSQARIVESYVALGANSHFNDAVTEIVGEQDTVIDYYRLQREGDRGFHVGRVAAQLARNCNFAAHTITLGGALVRNDLTAVVDGEGAQCALNGLYLVDGDQHVDNYTRIDHVKPHGTSVELYKGILGGSGRGVFNGKIMVHKDAQKTDARQANKNLLLSANAVVNTKPQLEIYADDVKCSHGSTIGQLDRDALFYLRSRGLDVESARRLLSYAFASDVVGRVKIPPMRARLDDYLLTKFGRN